MGVYRCKLCLEEKELLKESHIIPEFLYEKSRLYNIHHKFIETDTLGLKNQIKSYKPSGEYEQNILCKSCDNIIIGQTEDYAKRVLFDRKDNDFEVSNGIIKYRNVSYNKFKLFLLSILWRSSISVRPFFKNIKLDEKLEEELRIMIFKRDSKEYNIYSVIIVTSMYDKKYSINTIIEPYQWISAEDGNTSCRFFIGDFVFLFKVREITGHELKEIVITEDNILKLVVLEDGQTAKIVESETGIDIRQMNNSS